MSSISSPASPVLALNVCSATLKALVLRSSGKFENIDSPVLLVHHCTAPFGVELDSKFAPLPIFAGGSDPRKHLTMQLELSEEDANGLRRLDAACEAQSVSAGVWSPLVTMRDDRPFVKAKLLPESQRPTHFRVGDAALQSGWEHLGPILMENNLRGATVKAALRPMYVWSVSGRRGISLGLDQLIIEPRAPPIAVDHFR